MPKPWNVVEEGGFHYFIQGDIRVPLEKESVARTVQNTKKLNSQTIVTILAYNDVEAPLSSPVEATWPVAASFIQLAWYKKFAGSVEQNLVDQHCARLKRFKEQLAQDFKTTAVRTKPKRESKIDKRFIIVGEPGGASQLIIIMEELKKIQPATLTQLTAAVTRRGLTTRQPVERVVRYYLYKMYGTRFKEEGSDDPTDQNGEN